MWFDFLVKYFSAGRSIYTVLLMLERGLMTEGSKIMSGSS